MNRQQRRHDLRLSVMGSLVTHVMAYYYPMSREDAVSMIYSQADACQMVVRRGVRMTYFTTVVDIVDFFVPLGLQPPKLVLAPVTKRAKAAEVARALE